ncbi:MerR family transcriptional regulator [Nonomuraea solani]|uniref:MerR family transcriptional regulator n=1 Tax=Nonomuraea solani TaxID=1144553 RepID=UPI001F1DA96C|nr:MerR family transcriptional regulator [Nonomuraea solani]
MRFDADRGTESSDGRQRHQLRYYEAQGLLEADRGANGYREYNENAVLRVKQIRHLLGAGLSSEDIAYLLPCAVGEAPGAARMSRVTGRDAVTAAATGRSDGQARSIPRRSCRLHRCGRSNGQRELPGLPPGKARSSRRSSCRAGTSSSRSTVMTMTPNLSLTVVQPWAMTRPQSAEPPPTARCERATTGRGEARSSRRSPLWCSASQACAAGKRRGFRSAAAHSDAVNRRG